MNIKKFCSCYPLQRRGVVILCKSWLRNPSWRPPELWMTRLLPFNLFSFIHSSVAALLPSVPQKDDRYFFAFLGSLSCLCPNPPDFCPIGFFSSLRFQFNHVLFGEIFADIPAFCVICFPSQVKENVVQIHFNTGSIGLHGSSEVGEFQVTSLVPQQILSFSALQFP